MQSQTRENLIMVAYDIFLDGLKKRHYNFTEEELAPLAATLTLAFSVQGIEGAVDSLSEATEVAGDN